MVKVTGTCSELQAALKRISAIGQNPTPVLDAVGFHVLRHTRERMERGVDPQGRPWQALNPSYAAGKEGPGILRGKNYSTTGLYGSLTKRAQGNVLMWGSNKIYAAVHQFGAVIKPKPGSGKKTLSFVMGGHQIMARSVTIPARPYLGFTGDDRRAMLRELEAYVTRAMSRR